MAWKEDPQQKYKRIVPQEEEVPLPTAQLTISAGGKNSKEARGTWLSSQSPRHLCLSNWQGQRDSFSYPKTYDALPHPVRSGSSYCFFISSIWSSKVFLSLSLERTFLTSEESRSDLMLCPGHMLLHYSHSTHFPGQPTAYTEWELGKSNLIHVYDDGQFSHVQQHDFSLAVFLISKLEEEKREVSICFSSSLHLSYTILAKVHISSQLHSFYFPDVFMLQGQTSMIVPSLSDPDSICPCHFSPPHHSHPQLPGSCRRIYYNIFIILFTGAHSWKGQPLLETIRMGLTRLKNICRPYFDPSGQS